MHSEALSLLKAYKKFGFLFRFILTQGVQFVIVLLLCKFTFGGRKDACND